MWICHEIHSDSDSDSDSDLDIQLWCQIDKHWLCFTSQHRCPDAACYFITHCTHCYCNCNITTPLLSPFRNSTNKNFIYYAFCALPNSVTCIRLRFFIMLIFRIHVNFWFILHRLAKIASKLVQKLGRDKRSKSIQNVVYAGS